ncbi:colanic acid/amylovoran biosynthesis glycosyltransferase [Salegentibacter echinorum]|uniref:Colanic acid/amylovoran biosynthesis glycosyltransferase n=1 Tax=Salegentibacter echinorum TaxID=1073325 RepID=A0A1M5JW12_SALEC|nr:colanic acid/amylovoran biosynthesis glycosyltransferase [Salegentibacter echinorum]
MFKLWQFPHLSETFITAQIITAIKCGFEVSVLVKEALDFEESKQKSLIEEYEITDKIIPEDYKVPKNKLFRLLKIAFLLPNIFRNFIFFRRFLKEQKKLSLSLFYQFHFYTKFKDFDIIHVQYGTNRSPIDNFKKIGFFNSKLIVSFHGHDAFFPINGFIENNGYYDDLFLYGDLIIANTPYLARKIEELGCPAQKLKTIPVGVDASFFNGEKKKNQIEESFQLISVGRLDKVKGHKYAIKVVKSLKAKGFPVHLSIIGEGEERLALKNLIKEFKLESEVSLIGKKSQAEVKDYLLSGNLYILAAVPVENNRRETQGLATLEAQACGLPVVVFDSGGVKYTLKDGETGFIVPEFDTDKMVEKIEMLFSNRKKLETMSANAKAFVTQNFAQAIIDQRWCNLYSELVK